MDDDDDWKSNDRHGHSYCEQQDAHRLDDGTALNYWSSVSYDPSCCCCCSVHPATEVVLMKRRHRHDNDGCCC